MFCHPFFSFLAVPPLYQSLEPYSFPWNLPSSLPNFDCDLIIVAAQDPDPLSLLTDDLKDNDIGVAVTAYVPPTHLVFAVDHIKYLLIYSNLSSISLLLVSTLSDSLLPRCVVALIVIYSANRLTAVAAALGPRRVSNDLIPALPNFIQVPIDEVLAAIARQVS